MELCHGLRRLTGAVNCVVCAKIRSFATDNVANTRREPLPWITLSRQVPSFVLLVRRKTFAMDNVAGTENVAFAVDCVVHTDAVSYVACVYNVAKTEAWIA